MGGGSLSRGNNCYCQQNTADLSILNVLTYLLAEGGDWSYVDVFNSYHDVRHADILNAMWLIAITFLSVGYGEIVPNTYCGRAVAVIVGLLVVYAHHTQNIIIENIMVG